MLASLDLISFLFQISQKILGYEETLWPKKLEIINASQILTRASDSSSFLVIYNLIITLICRHSQQKTLTFSNFSCMFLNPNNFFQFELHKIVLIS